MQGRRRPAVPLSFAIVLSILAAGFSACATSPSTSSSPGPTRNENKVYFEIQSTSRNVATIFINNEERGDTPVFIRAEAAPTGGTMEDLAIRAVWNGGGGNDTEFTIPAGTTPQPIVKVGVNGEREY